MEVWDCEMGRVGDKVSGKWCGRRMKWREINYGDVNECWCSKETNHEGLDGGSPSET